MTAIIIAGACSGRYRWDYIQRSLSLGLHATIVIAGIAYSDRYRWRGTICNCICLQRSLLCSHHNCIITHAEILNAANVHLKLRCVLQETLALPG